MGTIRVIGWVTRYLTSRSRRPEAGLSRVRTRLLSAAKGRVVLETPNRTRAHRDAIQWSCYVKNSKILPGEPILCVSHKQPSTNPLFVATDDPEQILRILLKDRDPAIRLRAVEAWERFEERKRERQKAEPPSNKDGLDFGQLLPEERDDLKFHIACIKGIKQKLRDRLNPPEPEPEPIVPQLAPRCCCALKVLRVAPRMMLSSRS